MTEAQWLTSDDSLAMLSWIVWGEAEGHEAFGEWSRITPAVERKLLLFSAACCRGVWPLLPDPRSRRAVEVAERLADGAASYADYQAAAVGAREASHALIAAVVDDPDSVARFNAAHSNHFNAAMCAADLGTITFVDRYTDKAAGPSATAQGHADLVRDLFGNPFRPAAADSAAWRHPDVVHLARTIYADRAFHRMPELADLLGRVGCTDPSVLLHCRHSAPHARGCWVVDAILGHGKT